MNELSPLWISLKTAFVATLFTFFAGIAAARWMFNYQGKAKGLIDGFFTLPLVLPPTVVGFLLLLLFGKNSPTGQLLILLGIRVIFSWPATVIAATVVAFPLMYKTALGAFEQVDVDFSQAARTLGASEGRIFWQILLPLAWPGVVAGTILAFARALGEFGATLMLAGSIPGRTQTIPIAIFFAAEAGDLSKALDWVLLMVAISLTVIAGVNYWSQSQRPSKITRSTNTLLKHLFDWLLGGEIKFSPGGTRQSAARRRSSEDAPRSTLPSAGVGSLRVNLQKQLASFTLDVAFSAQQEPLGLLGASGSGKSMTLRCIAGLETPTQGRIILNGRVLFDAEQRINIPSRQRRIGFVFQNYVLFPHMSVAQNIAFGLQGLPRAERAQRVTQYLDLMQLQGLEARYPHQLSGGQQQRVALARALAIAPEVLLLDEPLSALDTYLRSQIEQLLTGVLASYQGVTLFVTHKLEEVYRVCSHLLVLSAGKVVDYGLKAEIFERPATFTVAQLTECKNFSAAQAIASHSLKALDWGCTLRAIEPIPTSLAYVGIRAHHLSFTDDLSRENTFPCWLVQRSETPHRMTLYLKLHTPPTHKGHQLQAEVFKEKWEVLKDKPFPWYICLDPLRLILLKQSA